ncbi:hypothetical protein GQ54DRAFT_299083 [Martensiomyces pterosporus]|nr:hypothetical protein GQ54DRAFT_299083 [Martensiomyces pterosporus]
MSNTFSTYASVPLFFFPPNRACLLFDAYLFSLFYPYNLFVFTLHKRECAYCGLQKRVLNLKSLPTRHLSKTRCQYQLSLYTCVRQERATAAIAEREYLRVFVFVRALCSLDLAGFFLPLLYWVCVGALQRQPTPTQY